MIVYSQSQKTERFKQLYESPVIFYIPKYRDTGLAKILAQEHYLALATISPGLAYSRQLHNGRV